MPGQTARSATKTQSKSARSKAAKNTRRVEAACNDELIGCTYGRITKTLGNKMFNVFDTDKHEHLGHIRGKMARVNVNDVVLLNIREYESRATTAAAVYDIMAVFSSKKDIKRLINANLIPGWFSKPDGEDGEDIFDYDESESENEDIDDRSKKDKKSHRGTGTGTGTGTSTTDSDGVDVDTI